ncbi:MAG: methyltransferase domain-containing protein [Acidimicrobiales bacterium]
MSSASLRHAMVDDLLASGAIRTETVRQAFEAVARELFVSEIAARDGVAAVYRPEVALVTARDERGQPLSSSSAPAIMAPMLEALELQKGLRVLEIGTGTGYNAALLRYLVGEEGRVSSIEIDPRFARRARAALAAAGCRCRVVVGDGHEGWPPGAPFDRIIATASSDGVPRAWHDQLVDGGLVVLPLRLSEVAWSQFITCLRREGPVLRSAAVIGGGFMPLRRHASSPAPSGPPPGVQTFIRAEGRCTLISLEGAGVGAFSAEGIKQALALVLGRSRRLRSLTGSAAAGFSTYLTLAAPSRVLRCTLGDRMGVAIVGEGGGSVAAVTCRPGKAGRIEAWGGAQAEELMAGHLERWQKAGSPTLSDVRLTVAFAERVPGRHWRTFRMGETAVAVDWRDQ